MIKQGEESYKEPEELPMLESKDKILDFIQELPEGLVRFRGQRNRPLSYVIRQEVAIQQEDDDLAFGEVGSRYLSLLDG